MDDVLEMNFPSIILLVIGGLLFATYAIGGSLTTSTEVNQLEPLRIPVTSPETLIGMDMGTGSTINSIEFTFRNALAVDVTVSVSIKDSSGVEIGSGSKILATSASVVTVDLTNTVTASERLTITSVSVTAV